MWRAVWRWSGGALVALLLLWVTTYFLHRPFRAAVPTPQAAFERLAHRGVHQNYHREGLDNQTCTATRIHPPTHDFLENTLDSTRAAYAAGATRVEIDVHLSADGVPVVFHDWTVDCRTEGQGETRTLTLAQLQALDIGYGYTADGGHSFPFRVRFKGAMPTLAELLQAFPEGHFLLDQKNPDPVLTRAIAQVLDAQGSSAWHRTCLQAREVRNAEFVAAAPPGVLACVWANKQAVRTCLLDVLGQPWRFAAPSSCAGRTLVVPDWAISRLLWGWPGTFVERLHAAGSRVLVLTDDPARAEHFRLLGFDGVWTDWIERWR